MNKKTIYIINGPNMNLIGSREPDIYGSKSLDCYLKELKTYFPDAEIAIFQSNVEGEIINILHKSFENKVHGIVLNAGAYSHTSLAIADAILAINIPIVEVHISNVFSRETIRKNMLTASACKGVISGLGLDAYRMAVNYLLSID